jgi:hypothetical protein
MHAHHHFTNHKDHMNDIQGRSAHTSPCAKSADDVRMATALWACYLEAQIALGAPDDPAETIVARAMLECAAWEPPVMREMVQIVTESTGDAAFAEAYGDIMLQTMKVVAIDLLLRAVRSRRGQR